MTIRSTNNSDTRGKMDGLISSIKDGSFDWSKSEDLMELCQYKFWANFLKKDVDINISVKEMPDSAKKWCIENLKSINVYGFFFDC
jgi:hypothetical protein